MEDKEAAVTVRVVDPATPPETACIVETPAVSAVARPEAEMVATDGVADDQVTEAVRRALGRPALVWHHADGRPEVAEEGIYVCAAHGAGILLAMASTGPADGKATTVRERSAQDWRAVLGRGQFDLAKRVGRETNEPFSVATTRVQAAAQHVHPGDPEAALTLTRSPADGWVQLGCATPVHDVPSGRIVIQVSASLPCSIR